MERGAQVARLGITDRSAADRSPRPTFPRTSRRCRGYSCSAIPVAWRRPVSLRSARPAASGAAVVDHRAARYLNSVWLGGVSSVLRAADVPALLWRRQLCDHRPPISPRSWPAGLRASGIGSGSYRRHGQSGKDHWSARPRVDHRVVQLPPAQRRHSMRSSRRSYFLRSGMRSPLAGRLRDERTLDRGDRCVANKKRQPRKYPVAPVLGIIGRRDVYAVMARGTEPPK